MAIPRFGAKSRRNLAWTAVGMSVAAVGATVAEARRRMIDTDDTARALTPDIDLLRGAFGRMTTPLLPDDYLTLLNPLWSKRELRGKVVEVRKETDTAATLVIKPGWGWSNEYQAGQYTGIATQIGGKWIWRSYSLTSPPTKDEDNISITVKATPEGFLSKHLVDGLEPGTVVRLQAPQGDFHLPDPTPEKVLFVTAGSGVTPVIGMLRTLARRGTFSDVVLLHSAKNARDELFRDELHAMQDEHDGFTLIERMTDTDGHIKPAELDSLVPDWKDRESWACGPNELLDAVEEHWQHYSLAEKLHTERFTVELAGSGGEGGTVGFSASGKEIEIDGATTILEAGEEVGVQLPYGCRMGICQSCVVELAEGSVRDLRNGDQKNAGDRIQTCVSTAAGNCTLRY